MVRLITKLLVYDLDERSKAIGSARSIADDGLIRVVGIGIDPNNVCGDVTLARSSDEHFLSSCFKVLPGTVPVDEYSGSLND